MHKFFEDNLEKLRARLIRLASLVEEQVDFSFRSLLEDNKNYLGIITERTAKVDKLSLKIEKQCQRLFALHQPVASDLRLLLAMLKINIELKYLHEVTLHVASVILQTEKCKEICLKFDVARLTNSSSKVIKIALDSFVNGDLELAHHVQPSKINVRSAARDIVIAMIEEMKTTPSIVDSCTKIILGLQSIERLCEHAINIAEGVIFLHESHNIRANGLEEKEETALGSMFFFDDAE